MAIRIPANQIQYKYTVGREYMVESTYKEYQGYYYQINGKLFAGKEFDSNAPELIPIPTDINNIPSKFNSLLTKASTYVYGKISGTKIPNLNISSIPYNSSEEFNTSDEENPPPQFFCKKINEQNIVIKRIDEKTYLSLLSNPLYKTTFIGIYNNIEQSALTANNQMPGLLDFIS